MGVNNGSMMIDIVDTFVWEFNVSMAVEQPSSGRPGSSYHWQA
jgi:hypothetical protein